MVAILIFTGPSALAICFRHSCIFTPHAQRERGKVIGRGVHIYMSVDEKKI